MIKSKRGVKKNGMNGKKKLIINISQTVTSLPDNFCDNHLQHLKVWTFLFSIISLLGGYYCCT